MQVDDFLSVIDREDGGFLRYIRPLGARVFDLYTKYLHFTIYHSFCITGFGLCTMLTRPRDSPWVPHYPRLTASMNPVSPSLAGVRLPPSCGTLTMFFAGQTVHALHLHTDAAS